MTYSAFATEQEGKPRVLTNCHGIAVVEDATQPFFTAIVNETLVSLRSLPTGMELLLAIANIAPADNRGFNVLIHRLSISYDMALLANDFWTMNPKGGRSFASPAQKQLGVASDAASIKNEGVSVLVGWCQNQVTYTPKVGPNKGVVQFIPPPVTLGHELIHALHALKGKSKSGRHILIDGKQTSEEEAYTVGLGPYSDKRFTENKLRDDVGLPRRLSYP